jgi:hypothetical protein
MRDMNLSPPVVIAIIAIIGVALVVIYSEGQKRKAVWAKLSEQLGLRREGGVLVGEHEGVAVRIAMEMKSNPDGQFFVVRAEVPGTLPAGFVAAPRRWTTGLDRMLSPNILSAPDPALKECYVFQSDRAPEGQALIDQPEVQKALLELFSPKRVGYVEENRTHVAYAGLVEDVAEIRMALKDVVQTARTLAAVQARLAPGADSRLTS